MAAIEHDIDVERTSPAHEPTSGRGHQLHVPSLAGHSLDEVGGLQPHIDGVPGPRLRPVERLDRHPSFGERPGRLEPGEDRDVVLWRRAPEDHATLIDQRLRAVAAVCCLPSAVSWIVVGEVVLIENGVAVPQV